MSKKNKLTIIVAISLTVILASFAVFTWLRPGRCTDEEYQTENGYDTTVLNGEEQTPGDADLPGVLLEVQGSIIDGLEPGLYFDLYPSLWEVYQDFFLIGAAGDSIPDTPWNSLAQPRDWLIAHHYNAWTFENSMKPQPIRGSEYRDVFNLIRVDTTLADVGALPAEFGFEHDMTFIGHTLAWHSQTPAWMWDGHEDGSFDRDIALANLHEHIDFVMETWGHRLQAIDVVNEAMGALNPDDPSDWRTSLTNHAQGWSLALGHEWVELAFLRAAYIADREGMDVRLYYNDFGLDGLGKATAVAAMVADINERHAGVRPNGRLLIEGIGMQGHYNMNTNIDNVAYNIRRFAQLGVMVSITELDISMLVTDPSGFLTPEEEILQGQIYAQLFQVLRRYAAGPATEGSGLPRVVERVTFWGTNDGNSWRSGSRPLLFNPVNAQGEITGKQALLAVLDPDRFLELHPIVPPEPVIIPGVYVFDQDTDGFTGIDIVLAGDGELAFDPVPGATYYLFVEYMIRGTFGLEAHLLDDVIRPSLYPRYVGGNEATTPVASGLPAFFEASPGAVNGSRAWLRVEFTMPDEPANIALRGLDGGSGFEFVQAQIHRIGAVGSEMLVNWPNLVPDMPAVPGIQVHSMARGYSFSHANIHIGSGRDVWPFADEPEDGAPRAFDPEPGVTYRIMFNVTSQSTNGWRVRWIPGLGGETYTTADAAIVNDYPMPMSAIGIEVPEITPDTPIATVIPAHFNIGGESGETYTLIIDITMDGSQGYMELIGNIALRGTMGGNAYDINWVRIERLVAGVGSEAAELLVFYY